MAMWKTEYERHAQEYNVYFKCPYCSEITLIIDRGGGMNVLGAHCHHYEDHRIKIRCVGEMIHDIYEVNYQLQK